MCACSLSLEPRVSLFLSCTLTCTYLSLSARTPRPLGSPLLASPLLALPRLTPLRTSRATTASLFINNTCNALAVLCCSLFSDSDDAENPHPVSGSQRTPYWTHSSPTAEISCSSSSSQHEMVDLNEARRTSQRQQPPHKPDAAQANFNAIAR